MIIQKEIIPNVDDLLTLQPSHVSEETKNKRYDDNDDPTNRRTSHFCWGDLHLPELRVDCHTQKDIAPIKRVACTQSLIGLPLSRIAEAIIAAAHAIAHRIRIVSRFEFVEEFAIGCSLPVFRFSTRDDQPSSHLKREIASQLNLQTIRGPLKSDAGGLIVDDEEIAVGPIDVTKPHVDD